LVVPAVAEGDERRERRSHQHQPEPEHKHYRRPDVCEESHCYACSSPKRLSTRMTAVFAQALRLREFAHLSNLQ
jgi:hypothetical protein